MVLNIFSITFYTDIIYHPEVEFCRIKMYDHYRQEKKHVLRKSKSHATERKKVLELFGFLLFSLIPNEFPTLVMVRNHYLDFLEFVQ